ncbi:MAG TPA: hypothetical protein VEP50_08875 [bacterium]|nr:hypothetical protein [bacterium]
MAGRRSDVGRALVATTVGVAVAGVLMLVVPRQPLDALTFPTAAAVIDRVLSAVRADRTSANVRIEFRIGRRTGTPECVFRGRLVVWPDRSALMIREWTPTPVCWVIDHFALARVLSDRDHADALLPRFRFEVIGEKLVEGRPHYLVYGHALTSETEPHWMIGWVDYERGVVTEGTLRYGWGEIDTAQEYAQTAGAWFPVRQRVEIPRFGAFLDITYDDIRVFPVGSASRRVAVRFPGVMVSTGSR